MDLVEVRRLARLARIELEPGEDANMAAGVGEMLDRLAALDAVEAGSLLEEPDAAPGGLPLREEVAAPDPLLIPPSRLAPAWASGMFVVPNPPGLETEG